MVYPDIFRILWYNIKIKVMTFTHYIESETTKYKREWLNSIISDVRQRIKSHLEGDMDRELYDELKLKQKTIMNKSATIKRFIFLKISSLLIT